MTREQLQRMTALKARVWASHTWHINLALVIERAFASQRGNEQRERRRRIETAQFERSKPALDAFIVDTKSRRASGRTWTDAQVKARAIARDAMLDGRIDEAMAVLKQEGMCLNDMIEAPRRARP